MYAVLCLGLLGSSYLVYRVSQVNAAPTQPAVDPPPKAAAEDPKGKAEEPKQKAPELDGGLEWLNCAGPIRLKDLKGKIVLLDFWTYCCINCIHTLPDLAKLEKKYANELVVIGVHSAKFDAEKDAKNIREAILRYHIEHPVVNDANHRIWDAYDVSSWPSLAVIDPEGNYLGSAHGEGNYELLDRVIEKLIKIHREKKTLNEQPLHFDLAKFRERKDSPLYFPGKVLADPASKRIFIADSSHHRIVITDLDGKKLDIAGTGEAGANNGGFEEATFNDPQGMTLQGETLYVADRKNHLIRALDLKKRKVSNLAGTGAQGHDRRSSGTPLTISLNSPWDLLLLGEDMYIAMAGHHQIWKLSLKDKRLGPMAGNGRENIYPSVTHEKEGAKGSWERSMFAQPSGLATDGKTLFVADSEVSAVRAVSLDPADRSVRTLVGEGLFEFADIDGVAEQVRLQHCLGVAFYEGKVFVADTYNNKIKTLDPKTQKCETFLGERKPGREDKPPRFDEPAGLCIAGDLLYLADTNNHRIRIVDLKTKEVRTLTLTGVTAPVPSAVASKPTFPDATTTALPEAVIPRDGELTLAITLTPPSGFKVNQLAPCRYLVETDEGFEQQGSLEDWKGALEIKVPADKIAQANSLKVSLAYLVCKEGSEAVCRMKSHVWEMPLKATAEAKGRVISLGTAEATTPRIGGSK
jgi:thiol-disulfide isomerase/thioredoxin